MKKRYILFILLGIVCFIGIYKVCNRNKEVNYYKSLGEEDIKQIGNVQWENTDYYGITSDYYRSDIAQVDDGYIVISGDMWSISIIKYDFNNNIIWQNISKNFYGYMMGSDIISYIKDNKLYVFACSNLDSINESECYMYIYDLNGNLILDGEYFSCSNIVEVEDGFLLHNDEDIFKIDLYGNKVFHNSIDFIVEYETKEHKYSSSMLHTSAIQVKDGIIYLKSRKIEGIEYDEQFIIHKSYLVKYDFNGNLLWEKEFDKCFYSDISTTKNGFLAIGPDNCVKYDLNGEQIWENPKLTCINENYYAYKVIEVNEGNIIFMSDERYGDLGASYTGRWFVKCDFDGNILYEEENVISSNNFYIKNNLDSFILYEVYSSAFVEYDFKGNLIFKGEGSWYGSPKVFKSLEGYTIYIKSPESLEIEKYDLNGNLIEKCKGKSIHSFGKVDEIQDEIYAGYAYWWGTSDIHGTLKLDYNGEVLEDDVYYEKFFQNRIIVGDYIFEYNDYYNDSIKKYDLDGNFIAELPIFVNPECGDIIADENSLIVLNESYSPNNCSFSKYDLDGNKIWQIDGGDRYSGIEFTGLAKVKDGYLVCCNNGLILKYNFDGIIVGENTQEVEKFGYGYRDIVVVSDGFVCVSKMGAIVKYTYDLLELTVHHYLDETTEIVAPDEKLYGERGESYTTNPAEIPILDEKYELVQEKYPSNSSGIFGQNEEDIIYYYKKKDSNVKVLHILENTDVSNPGNVIDVLFPTEEINGRVDDSYKTQDRLKEINESRVEQYELVSTTENASGNMTINTQYVIYVYRKIPSKIKIKHMDKTTDVELLETEIREDYVGKSYETQNRLDEINEKYEDNYILVSEPDNKKGIYEIKEQEIIYYYMKTQVKAEEKPDDGNIDSSTQEINNKIDNIETGDDVNKIVIIVLLSIIGIVYICKNIKKGSNG